MRNQPFTLTASAKGLNTAYLSPSEFRNALTNLEDFELMGFLRTYVEEGVPFLFGERPMVWEALREWLGRRLNVRANHITVIGSARIGFTVKPAEFGRTLSEKSDLDLSIIDSNLFERCRKDALKFSMDFDFKKVLARSVTEERYWTENSKSIQQNIKYGFVDTKLVPNFHEKYPGSVDVNDAASVVHSRLAATGIVIKSASVRIYSDWDCFVNRILLNYNTIRKKLKAADSQQA